METGASVASSKHGSPEGTGAAICAGRGKTLCDAAIDSARNSDIAFPPIYAKGAEMDGAP
jgi:hypothetical protein